MSSIQAADLLHHASHPCTLHRSFTCFPLLLLLDGCSLTARDPSWATQSSPGSISTRLSSLCLLTGGAGEGLCHRHGCACPLDLLLQLQDPVRRRLLACSCCVTAGRVCLGSAIASDALQGL